MGNTTKQLWNRSGKARTDRVVGRLPRHIDKEERFIVIKGSGDMTGGRGRVLEDYPAERAEGAPQNQMAHADRDMMVFETKTPEDGMSGMNRAARRRAAKAERRG